MADTGGGVAPLLPKRPSDLNPADNKMPVAPSRPAPPPPGGRPPPLVPQNGQPQTSPISSTNKTDLLDRPIRPDTSRSSQPMVTAKSTGRKRPEITIVSARPMSEMGFRSSVPSSTIEHPVSTSEHGPPIPAHATDEMPRTLVAAPMKSRDHPPPPSRPPVIKGPKDQSSPNEETRIPKPRSPRGLPPPNMPPPPAPSAAPPPPPPRPSPTQVPENLNDDFLSFEEVAEKTKVPTTKLKRPTIIRPTKLPVDGEILVGIKVDDDRASVPSAKAKANPAETVLIDFTKNAMETKDGNDNMFPKLRPTVSERLNSENSSGLEQIIDTNFKKTDFGEGKIAEDVPESKAPKRPTVIRAPPKPQRTANVQESTPDTILEKPIVPSSDHNGPSLPPRKPLLTSDIDIDHKPVLDGVKPRINKLPVAVRRPQSQAESPEEHSSPSELSSNGSSSGVSNRPRSIVDMIGKFETAKDKDESVAIKPKPFKRPSVPILAAKPKTASRNIDINKIEDSTRKDDIIPKQISSNPDIISMGTTVEPKSDAQVMPRPLVASRRLNTSVEKPALMPEKVEEVKPKSSTPARPSFKPPSAPDPIPPLSPARTTSLPKDEEDVLPKLEVPEMKQLPVEPKQPPSRPKAGPKRPSAGPVIPTPSADKGQGMSQPAKQMGRRGAGARPKVPAQEEEPGPPSLPNRPGPGHPLYEYTMSEPHGIALFDYKATQPDELSFKPGELIFILEDIDDSWLRGKKGDKKGIFPKNFLEVVTPLPVLMDVTDMDMEPMGPVEGADAEGRIPCPMEGPCCQARFDYDGENDSDLTFEEDDLIRLLERVGADWMKGELNGKTGIFPLSFVELIEDLPPEPIVVPARDKDSMEVTAMFDFAGQGDELSFEAGDTIILLGRVSEDWVVGEKGDQRGQFPAAFVDRIPENLPQLEKDSPQRNSMQEDQDPTKGPHCVAIHSYQGEQDGDLSFSDGEIIQLIEHLGADWLKGKIKKITGIFPCNFVNVVIDL